VFAENDDKEPALEYMLLPTGSGRAGDDVLFFVFVFLLKRFM